MKAVAWGATALGVLLAPVLVVLMVAWPSSGQGFAVSAAAVADIPPDMLALYQQAVLARCPNLPWPVLAAVGKVETDHARAVAVSSAGALGPMQFMPGTWRAYGIDANGDGVADVLDAVDAVHSAAAYLCAAGGDNPATLREAIWAYNHADWYVELVLEHARRYSVAVEARPELDTLLASPRLILSPRARDDLAAGLVDARVVALLATLTERHEIGVSVVRTGHTKYVAGTRRVSYHWCGQAADIWMVDGQAVSAGHPGARAVAEWLATLSVPLRPTEVGTPWLDLVGGGFFSDRAHAGHLHVGYGPRCADS